VWGHHFPKITAVNHLISSDICFHMIQEATTWSTTIALCDLKSIVLSG
jgi:hypothetical protein